MATNKRKVMLPHTMGQKGIAIIRARDDIEMVRRGSHKANCCRC